MENGKTHATVEHYCRQSHWFHSEAVTPHKRNSVKGNNCERWVEGGWKEERERVETMELWMGMGGGMMWHGFPKCKGGWKSCQQQEHLSNFRHWQKQCIPMQIINARPQRWGWIVYRCMQKQKVKTKQKKSLFFVFWKSWKRGKLTLKQHLRQ